MGTWTRPNNRSSVVIDGMTFNIGDLMGAGLDPFDNLGSRAVMDALARHNQAKNIFNLNPLFLGTRPEDTYQEEDDLSNPLLAPNPLLAQEADNTGPFVTDPAAGTDTPVASGGNDTVADEDNTEPEITSETPEDILAKYSNKDRADPVTDMLGDYKQEDGTNFPVNVLIGIISDYAINKDNKDAQVILGKWNDKVGANQAAAAANNQVDSGAEDTGIPTGGTPTGGTPTGGTPQGQTVTPQGKTSTPQGGTPTPQGGTPQGGTQTGAVPANNTPAIDSPPGTPTVSTGSVLDQTDTGDVTVDDQPIGLPSIPMPTPRQPEKKAGMIMQIAQSAPIVETVLDDYLYPPMFRELNNVKQSPFPTALLFSNGLMGSFV